MKNPTQEQIKRRAYEIYLNHGKLGSDLQNWLRAEQELTEISERDQIETAVWEDTSTRRGRDTHRVTIRPERDQEYKKDF
jgi:hypothetical protein